VLDLTLLPERLAVCHLEPNEDVPRWAFRSPMSSVTRTDRELSIVCPEAAVPPGIRAERGFRVLEVSGPLDFALTGILASLLDPLAEAGVSVFAISTHDTDYVLVRDESVPRALEALRRAGHRIAGMPGSVEAESL